MDEKLEKTTGDDEDKPFFVRESKWQIVFAITAGLILYIIFTAILGGVEQNQGAILLDFSLFLLGIIACLFFFGQFVLPVRNLRERLGVASRLARYLFGEHGPVTTIRNGEILEPEAHTKERGPGIVLLDTASAAMLRTEVKFSRPVGPGVAFTHFSPWPWNRTFEYLASAADLRRQSSLLGPKFEPYEDPFAAKNKNEGEATYLERQKRRDETSAMTRDGIEVVPVLFVSFQLNCERTNDFAQFAYPNKNVQPAAAKTATLQTLGYTLFGYDGETIRHALTSEAIEPGIPLEDERHRVPWNKLPGVLAVDVWRETLHMFTLDDLFRDLPDRVVMPNNPPGVPGVPPPTTLQFISTRIRQRLTQDVVEELDAFGRPTGRPVPSEEFRHLQRRGVKVYAAVVVKLFLPQPVEEQLVSRWESTWLAQAKLEKDLLEQQLSYIKERGHIDAMREYANVAIRRLGHLSAGREYGGNEVLRELLRGSLHLIIRDRQLHQQAEKERDELVELINWAERDAQ